MIKWVVDRLRVLQDTYFPKTHVLMYSLLFNAPTVALHHGDSLNAHVSSPSEIMGAPGQCQLVLLRQLLARQLLWHRLVLFLVSRIGPVVRFE